MNSYNVDNAALKLSSDANEFRHPNSPSRPSKALPETRLKFSELKISGLDEPGHFMTRLQDCRPYSPLIASHTEIDIQFNEA